VRVVEGEKVIKVPEGVKEGIKDVCVLLLRGRPGLGRRRADVRRVLAQESELEPCQEEVGD
jgi:hypothetical protein